MPNVVASQPNKPLDPPAEAAAGQRRRWADGDAGWEMRASWEEVHSNAANLQVCRRRQRRALGLRHSP